MTKNKDIANILDQATTFAVSAAVGADVIANTVAFSVGNTLSKIIANSTVVWIGNTGTSATVNSSTFSGTANNASYLGGTAAGDYELSSDLAADVAILDANNASFLGGLDSSEYANLSTATFTVQAGVGANVIANTTAIRVGDNSINVVANSSQIKVLDATSNSALSSSQLLLKVAGVNAIVNTTEISITNATHQLWGSAKEWWTHELNAKTFLSIGNSTVNVTANATNIRVGGTTDNLVVNVTSIKISNSTVNTQLTLPTTTQYGGTYFLHANGTWATPPGGNPQGGNTYVQFDDSDVFGGSAGFTYNKTTNNVLIANTLTLGVSGNTINSTVWSGKALTANDSAYLGGLVASGWANLSTATFTTAVWPSSNTVPLGNATARWVITANSVDVGPGVTANSTLVNAPALNITNQVNTATLYATTTANVGALQVNTTTINIGGNTVNSTVWTGKAYTANDSTNLGGTAASSYQKTGTDLVNNVATMSANNAAYLGGTAAADYQTEAGLSANVATMTANNANNFNGHAESYYANVTTPTFTTSINVGANVQVNTTALFIGNTTVNGTANAIFVGVSNSSGSANLTPLALTVGISVVNATEIAVGANVFANATQFRVTNSTSNTYMTALRFGASESGAAGNWVQTSPNDIEVGNGSITTFLSAQGLYVSTDPDGRSVTANQSYLAVGNSSVNIATNTTILQIRDTGWTSTLESWRFVIKQGATTVFFIDNDELQLGNSSFNTWASWGELSMSNSTTTNYLNQGISKLGNSTCNVTSNSTSIKVGSNVIVTTADLTLGNTSVNLVANSMTIKLANSTSNTYIAVPNTTAYSGSYYLHANGSWAQVLATPGGSNTHIQFSNSGAFDGSAGFTFDKTTNTVTIANTLAIGANVSLTTTDLKIGNTTVNGAANSVFISLANSSSTANLTPIDLTIGNTIVNSTIITTTGVVNALTASANAFIGVPTSATTNGYCYLFNGLILQWGWVSSNSSVGNITLPTSFTTEIYSYSAVSGTTDHVYVTAANNTTMNVRSANVGTGHTVRWMAIGK